MLRRYTGFACLLLLGHAQAQTIDMVHGEYWIDQDLGIGANIPFTLSGAPDISGLDLPINLAGFGVGTHTIGIRTLDADGHWSLTHFSSAVVIDEPPATPLVEIEYFLNEDPGLGNGLTAWTGNSIDTLGATFNADLSAATEGIHTLFIRSRTSDGAWGLTNHQAVLVITPEATTDIARVETFALSQVDPGFGLADQHVVTVPATDLSAYALENPVPVNFMLHDTLMVRCMDANGRWSLTNHVTVLGHTSVESLNTTVNISVYPNPFTEGITVRTGDGQPMRVILYDAQGKLMYDQVLRKEIHMDLGQHASGSYTAFFWKELKLMHRVQLVKQ